MSEALPFMSENFDAGSLMILDAVCMIWLVWFDLFLLKQEGLCSRIDVLISKLSL